MFSATTLEQIGQTVLRSLEHAELTKNQYVRVSSFETTQLEVVAALEKVTGERFVRQEVSSEDLIARGREKLAVHDYQGGVPPLLHAVIFGAASNLGDSSRLGLWNDRLGLAKVELEGIVRAVVDAA